MKALRILISGRVQGVGFRWFAERQATEYGIDGYVRNLVDGRVEVFAQGDKAVLDAFCNQLREGPRHSRPEELTTSEAPVDPGLHGFQIRF